MRPILCLLAVIVTLLSGCTSTEEAYNRGDDEIRLIETNQPARPEWLDATPPPSGKFYYFVGTSENATTEAHAQDMAGAAALKKAATYCGVTITGTSERVTESQFKASETSDPSIQETDRVLQSARAYFSRFRDDQWYIEHFGRVKKKKIYDSSYRAAVLLSIPTEEIEVAIQESRKRHESPEELVSMEDLKAKETEMLARIKKIRSLIDQAEKNVSLENQAQELENKATQLENRIKDGVKSSSELRDIMAELDLTERTAIATFPSTSLFSSATAEIERKRQQVKWMEDMAEYVATNLYIVRLGKPAIGNTDMSNGTADIDISVDVDYDYETVRRLAEALSNFQGTQGTDAYALQYQESPNSSARTVTANFYPEASQALASYLPTMELAATSGSQKMGFLWEVEFGIYNVKGRILDRFSLRFGTSLGGDLLGKTTFGNKRGILEVDKKLLGFNRGDPAVVNNTQSFPKTFTYTTTLEAIRELNEVKVVKKAYCSGPPSVDGAWHIIK